jgi:hypothetical protein
MRYGRPYVLVRWTGRDASGDTYQWEPLEHLINCEEAIMIAVFERATGRTLPRPAPRPAPLAAGPASAPSPLPPARFTVDPAPPPDLGAALVGHQLLYWWPDDGWQPSPASAREPRSRTWWPTPGRRRRGAARQTRCLTPPPTVPGGCCCPPPRPRACGAAPAPTHDFGFGVCLVTALAEPDGLTRAQQLDAESSLSQSRLLAPSPEYKPMGRKLRNY